MSSPLLVRDRSALAGALEEGPRVAVMTMGALHQGHLDLVAAARRHEPAGQVIVTIFVNPLQFGPTEDYEAYPRTLDADLETLEGIGADLVYAPSVRDMYPGGKPRVTVDPGPLGQVFEGAIRPGHFTGVTTVVHKLASRTVATAAVFGQKDAQQLAVIRQMNQDLDLGWEVIAVPTRREADGLAMSSRNRYLTAAEREQALALPRGLDAGREAARGGAGACQVRQAARRAAGLAGGPAGGLEAPDYFEVVDPATFMPLDDSWDGRPALLIGALRVGHTRLIDNTGVSWMIE
ncbi:MAG: pantoate--beta-alanine ligase [Bifidobacteriaceae bacterium]|jgi:pantoate--beta-alanine ligase|nr:pantoate--beta-alanine ligase [Bifidobacteriaceae bacterium]